MVLVTVAACARGGDGSPEDLAARYLGRGACARCHAEQVALHRGSDHDRAMAVATESSVLGNFEGAAFLDAGRIVRFDRRDDTYWIEIEDDEGGTQRIRVLYTFGADPLADTVRLVRVASAPALACVNLQSDPGDPLEAGPGS